MHTLTNKKQVPLSLAVWLAHDEYDYNPDPYTISATTLMKPLKAIILGLQNKDMDTSMDIFGLVPSSLGTSIHDGIEKAWKSPKLKETLRKLGYPETVVNNLKVNPTEEELKDPNIIPVYIEQRYSRKHGKYTISGAMDFIGNGGLEDFKSTSVWSHIFSSNDEQYIIQGSIYRWITPDRITQETMAIRKIFTDWSKSAAMQRKDYPQRRLLSKEFALMSEPKTDMWIGARLKIIDESRNLTQDLLPACTKEDLWQSDTKYKYYKDPTKTARSIKNFDSSAEAQARYIKDGSVGMVKVIQGEVKRCKYCNVRPFCEQAKLLTEQGLIIDED